MKKITEKEFRIWVNGFLNALIKPLPDWFPTDKQVQQLSDAIDEEILNDIKKKIKKRK